MILVAFGIADIRRARRQRTAMRRREFPQQGIALCWQAQGVAMHRGGEQLKFGLCRRLVGREQRLQPRQPRTDRRGVHGGLDDHLQAAPPVCREIRGLFDPIVQPFLRPIVVTAAVVGDGPSE